MAKIIKRTVVALRPDPSGKDVFLWDAGDGAVKGFGLRMKKSGTASYLVQYRNAEGRTRRLVLGAVNVLTPDQARKLAVDALQAAAKGGDPSADRHAVRGAMTVSELCDRYLVDAATRIKPSTLKKDKGRIETHIKPLIGKRSVRGLTSNDIEKLKVDIVNGKTAAPRQSGRGGIATGGPQAARRCLGLLGTILEYGVRLKIIPTNPARGIKKPADRKQTRYLSLDEIATLGTTMRASGENPTALAAIKLLLLTGLRREEALALPRTWIDCRGHCVRFEDTKTGAQIRPIGTAAIALIEKNLLNHNSSWLFPAERGTGHYVGLPKVLERLCARAELRGVTVHVLRHSFASVAAELGFSELVIAGLLGHSVPGVTARYSHLPDRALIVAADAVSAHVAKMLG